jgi:hypothetical protein
LRHQKTGINMWNLIWRSKKKKKKSNNKNSSFKFHFMVVTRTLPFHFYSPFCPETDDSHTNRTGKSSFVHLLITVPQFPALEFPGIWNHSRLCVCVCVWFGFVGFVRYVCCAELRIENSQVFVFV